MSLLQTIFWLAGAAAMYCLAIGMLNVGTRYRHAAAALLGALWLPIVLIAAAFLLIDGVELAYRRYCARRRI